MRHKPAFAAMSIVLIISVCWLSSVHAGGKTQGTPVKSRQYSGTLSEYMSIGIMKGDGSFLIEGIAFRMEEHPGKEFKYYAKSFDKFVQAGFMSIDENDVMEFNDITGRKVVVTAKPEKDYLKVLTVKWIPDDDERAEE